MPHRSVQSLFIAFIAFIAFKLVWLYCCPRLSQPFCKQRRVRDLYEAPLRIVLMMRCQVMKDEGLKHGKPGKLIHDSLRRAVGHVHVRELETLGMAVCLQDFAQCSGTTNPLPDAQKFQMWESQQWQSSVEIKGAILVAVVHASTQVEGLHSWTG